MRIIFFGTPDFAVPSLHALLSSGHEVLLVVSQPDRPKGRGHSVDPTPIKALATLYRVPVIQPFSLREPAFLSQLQEIAPDCIVVVAYGKILPVNILSLPVSGCINVHASILPKYRGAAPIQCALINGESVTGITTMLMDEGLDTGDILLQETTVIKQGDTAYSLGKRLSEIGAELLVKTLSGIADSTVKPVQQSGEPTYAPPLKKDTGRITWNLPAVNLFNLFRGTFPWPGAYFYSNGERIVIMKAEPAENTSSGQPGTVISISRKGISVLTGNGILTLVEVKPEGKKTMTGQAFANGRRLSEGTRFS